MKRHTAWFRAAALLIACAAAWPLLSEPGLLNTRGGGDSPFLLQRLHQLAAAVSDGHFPVRWMPDANYGYGYPFYNYYAPLSIYIAGFFRLIGFGFVASVKLAQLAAFLVAAWGAFELGRRWLRSHWAGLLTSAAYTLAPFHLVNVYVRGDSLAEFWAMAFYPFLLLAVSDSRPKTNGEKWLAGGWVGLALVWAGLILSHNISALIFTPFALLYLAIWLIWPAGEEEETPASLWRWRKLVMTGLGFVFALALSAWFWLPALAEQSLAQLEPVTAGYFHYSAHFRSADLAQTSLLFDYDVAEGRAFRMGLAQALLILAGLATLLAKPLLVDRRPLRRYPAAWLFIPLALFIATWMITPWSRPLWDHLPLLSFTQFPWRFLSVQALLGALAVGALAWLPRPKLLAPPLIGLALLAALGDLRVDHLTLTDNDVTPARLAEYEWFTGNIGSTVSAEYLPAGAQPRPYTSAWLNGGERNRVSLLEGAGEIRLLERQTTRQLWQMEIEAGPARLVLPTLYWPGWQGQLNGRPVELQAAPGSGLIMLDAPEGAHTLSLRLQRTPVRLLAELLSLAALAGLAYLIWLRRRSVFDYWRSGRRPYFLAGAALLLLLLVIGLRLRPATPPAAPDTLTWDFAQMGYLHHAPEGVLFEDGQSLLRYEYSEERITAGSRWTITLYLEQAAPQPVTVALVSPAANRFAQAPALAEGSAAADGRTTISLTIPEQAPAGLYLPHLEMAGAAPLTPAGQERGPLFLRPVRVESSPLPAVEAAGQPVQATVIQAEWRTEGLPAAPAGCIGEAAGAAALDLHLAWFMERPASHNYNVSLRLTDAAGRQLLQCDSQPGYGFNPSQNWPAGEWVSDWLTLPLPELAAGEGPYAVTAHLYEAGSGAAVLTRRLGEARETAGVWRFQAAEPQFSLPDDIVPLTAFFEDQIALRGYRLEQENGQVRLTLYWEALQLIEADYYHFVHLIDPQVDGAPPAQHDSMPQLNSYPTSQWTAGEIVADPAFLVLDDVPPGNYRLAVGLYRPADGAFPRLAVTDEHGILLPHDRLLLPEVIIVGE